MSHDLLEFLQRNGEHSTYLTTFPEVLLRILRKLAVCFIIYHTNETAVVVRIA